MHFFNARVAGGQTRDFKFIVVECTCDLYMCHSHFLSKNPMKESIARIRQLFEKVIEIHSSSDRSEFLDQHCGDDKDLREEVEALVKAHDAAGSFLGREEQTSQPVGEALTTGAGDRIKSQVVFGRGTIISHYKLLQQIGTGGMGAVWMAEQETPVRRRAALKLILGDIGNQDTIARFEAERQALAMMEHPNIARVFDAGTTDGGTPWFVMELVKGIPITKYCDENKLGIRERLKLMVPVCRAVQHAHHKGIVHRDLKPSNVLVTLYDGHPVPKIIDFGLAKALAHQVRLTDKTLFTEFGKVVGTLQYMSPEQAELNALDVDTRTDIYSLGVLLYELLTGTTPIDKSTVGEKAVLQILAMIKETEPPRPSTRLSQSGEAVTGISVQRRIAPARLRDILKGELDWIVMKALEKDRTRRYETANGLAIDIERHLRGDSVQARPPSTYYQIQKFLARNRALAISAILLVLILSLSTAISWWFAIKAGQSAKLANKEKLTALAAQKTTQELLGKVSKQRSELEKSQEEVLRKSNRLSKQNYILSLQNAQRSLEAGELGAARELLRAAPEEHRQWCWEMLWSEAHPTLIEYQWKKEEKLLAVSPYGKMAVIGPRIEAVNSKQLSLINCSDGKLITEFRLPKCEYIFSASTSKNAERIAILAVTASGKLDTYETTLYVWDQNLNDFCYILKSKFDSEFGLMNGDIQVNADGTKVSIVTAQAHKFPSWSSFQESRYYGRSFILDLDNEGQMIELKGNGRHFADANFNAFVTWGFNERLELIDAQSYAKENSVAAGQSINRKLPGKIFGVSGLSKSSNQFIPESSLVAFYGNDFGWRIFDYQKNTETSLNFKHKNISDFFNTKVRFYSKGNCALFIQGNELRACRLDDDFRDGISYSIRGVRLGYTPSRFGEIHVNENDGLVVLTTEQQLLCYPLPSAEEISFLRRMQSPSSAMGHRQRRRSLFRGKIYIARLP